MSGIVFTNPQSRGNDIGGDVAWIGGNFESGRVTVGFRKQPSGELITFTYEGPDLQALRQRVSQLNGLRLAILEDLISQGKIPGGVAT